MKKHISNASWGGFAAGFRAVYGLISVLLIVRLLGPESYGQVVALLAFFTFYCSLSASIFTMLVVRLMAAPSEAEREQLLAAGRLWTVCAVTAITLLALFTSLLAAEDVSPAVWLPTPTTAYIILAMSALASLQIASAFQLAMIESAGRFDIATKSQLLGPSLILLFLMTALLGDIEMSSHLYVLILCAGASTDLCLAWMAKRKVFLTMVRGSAGLRQALQGLRQLLKSGSMLQATSLMNMFLEPLNKTLLNYFLGGTAVTVYDLSMKLVWGIQSLFTSAMRVFLHIASQELDQLETSYLKAIRLIIVPVLLLHVLACLFLAVVAHYWLSLDPLKPTIFFAIATLSNLGMIGAAPLYNALIGAENTVFIFQIQARLAVTNVAVSFCLIPTLGVLGAAVGLLIATLCNVWAILQKSKDLTGNDQLIRLVVRSMGSRFGWAASMFGLAVYFGVEGSLMVPLALTISICTLLMLAFEPITPLLFRALRQSGGH